MINTRNPIFRRLALIGFAAALLATAPLARSQDSDTEKFQLSEKVSDALQKLKPLQDTKNFSGMLDLVNKELQQVPPTSYDASYLLDIKAKIYLQLEQYNTAIAPWEQALQLAEQHPGYMSKKDMLEITKFLAQLIFSEATALKDKAHQQELIGKSAEYLKRYLAQITTPEPDVELLYAQIIFFRATADEHHINQALLTEARSLVEKSMLSTIRPREGTYLLLLAILQQQNETERSAEVMELLLQQYPNKKDIWPTLFGTYVNLGGSAKRPSEQRQWFVRAINTLERAQALGYMKTEHDNYNRFTLYLNAGAVNIATDILYDGMKKGLIASTPENWRVLGSYLQQEGKDLQAVNALKEATRLFPKDGNLEFMVGQIYQGMDETKQAHDHYLAAVKKGDLGDKPHQVYLFLAYTSLELEQFQQALDAINHAAKLPDGAKDPQVQNLMRGIKATMQDRAAAAEATKAGKAKKATPTVEKSENDEESEKSDEAEKEPATTL